MSRPHAYTIGMPPLHQPDEDDDDICPICEGACTCNSQSNPAPPQPSTSRSTSTYPISSRSSPPTTALATPPSAPHGPLKIKLTVPASLLARARLHAVPTTSGSSSTPKKLSGAAETSGPKRRGRPPKAVAAARAAAFTDALKGKKPVTPRSKPRDTIGKPSRRKTVPTAASDDDYFPAGAVPQSLRRPSADAEDFHAFEDEDDLDETRSLQFPTFVSAVSSSSADESSSSASASDGEDSELSDFSDSSIENEEEQFIQAEEQQRVHNKARVKRELLGDGAMKWKERQNAWEIQTRKKSVDPSGDEMDVDSDETEEDGDDDADGEDGEDDEGEDEDEDDVHLPGAAYAGIATGWSEDEESSFDAELFFAGLTDSESGPDGADAQDRDDTADEDEIDDETMLQLNAVALAAQGIFEVTEGWDGSVIFTNGLQDGQGLLDWDFEASAAQLVEAAGSFSTTTSGSDTDMQMSDGVSNMGDSEDEEDGLEEMESDDGETTEEELVDAQGLPTPRAMRLFRPPTTPLSSINPMSTMTPGARSRNAGAHRDSPKPADILAGMFWDEDSDDRDSPSPPIHDVASMSLRSPDRGTPKHPSMGTFSVGDSLRRAVIDGSHKQDLPSPFPRHRKRRFSESISGRSLSRSRDRSLSLSHTSSTFSPSPFGLLDASDDAPPPSSPSLTPAEPIRLDDVLDASLLDSDPFDNPAHVASSSTAGDPETSAAEDAERHLQSLSRWDRIPMGTFRRTRESGLMSDSAAELTYGGMLRSSPFSGMWQDGKDGGPSSSPLARKNKASKKNAKGSMDVVISPVILPMRDGDHTPTNGQGGYTPPHSKPRKERESRRDKMLKRKSMMGSASGRRPQQQYHHHGHHPNAKGRAAGSVQRGFFGGGSVPPLNL
ncbi:hypothetical protein BV25DRAFT_1839279 [Artomyces pyxidatus]|uniref:Uncharacterized protein n=1 Tax=Artomyces pyxidatus TaxID=48021 RepID=A0ACB8SXX5_9AGAM|nr:hypothetical protein BV25DRAFT_1839279 [Artomyces pyxidatus]